MARMVVSGMIEYTFTVEAETSEEAIEKVTNNVDVRCDSALDSEWSLTDMEVGDADDEDEDEE